MSRSSLSTVPVSRIVATLIQTPGGMAIVESLGGMLAVASLWATLAGDSPVR
jgi:hypothetical protein